MKNRCSYNSCGTVRCSVHGYTISSVTYRITVIDEESHSIKYRKIVPYPLCMVDSVKARGKIIDIVLSLTRCHLSVTIYIVYT